MILVNNNLDKKNTPSKEEYFHLRWGKNFYPQLYRAYLGQTCYDISYKVSEDEFTENKDGYC